MCVHRLSYCHTHIHLTIRHACIHTLDTSCPVLRFDILHKLGHWQKYLLCLIHHPSSPSTLQTLSPLAKLNGHAGPSANLWSGSTWSVD